MPPALRAMSPTVFTACAPAPRYACGAAVWSCSQACRCTSCSRASIAACAASPFAPPLCGPLAPPSSVCNQDKLDKHCAKDLGLGSLDSSIRPNASNSARSSTVFVDAGARDACGRRAAWRPAGATVGAACGAGPGRSSSIDAGASREADRRRLLLVCRRSSAMRTSCSLWATSPSSCTQFSGASGATRCSRRRRKGCARTARSRASHSPGRSSQDRNIRVDGEAREWIVLSSGCRKSGL
mmetsp:Transcript_30508/g.78956  ORF Transcript_30508/g.78956 Transcript_30508/m.78956 type:complete len:240 (-) Transcript_30508:812-1531(-)